jgi:hypothetical protein
VANLLRLTRIPKSGQEPETAHIRGEDSRHIISHDRGEGGIHPTSPCARLREECDVRAPSAEGLYREINGLDAESNCDVRLLGRDNEVLDNAVTGEEFPRRRISRPGRQARVDGGVLDIGMAQPVFNE